MPMFGYVDVVAAGIMGLMVLIAVIVPMPDLIRTLRFHSM